MIFRVLIVLFLFSIMFGQEEFSEGPYGINYFDTAGSFTVQDLNSPVIEFAYQGPLLNYKGEKIFFVITGDVKFQITKSTK